MQLPVRLRVNGMNVLALATFVVLTTSVATYHEPWRDEADSWLMARDASLSEMLHVAGYAGTPVLWYLIQAPLAKAGAPYVSQRYLHLVIATSVAGVLLFRGPFPFVTRLALVFGYFLSFEYAVVARNYSCGILLCFIALVLDGERAKLAALYGLAIGLAANASVHFTILATALVIPVIWDAARSGARWAGRVGIGLALTGIALAVWQLWPPPDGQLPPGMFTRFETFRISDALSEAFAPRARGGHWKLTLGVLATGLVVARLWSAPRALLVFGLSSAGLFYVFVFKYASGVHHYGLFFVAIVIALWMAEGTALAGNAILWHRVFTVAMVVVLLPSVYVATRVWMLEVRYAFSEAGDMARFIQVSHLEGARIAAHPPMASVLAFLPRRTFWYPALGEEGSHMKWDARYRRAWEMTLSTAIARLKAQCPDWQNSRDPMLLLVNTALPEANLEGYRLLYSTPGRPWLVEDEVFYLYAPTSSSPDTLNRGHDTASRKRVCEGAAGLPGPPPQTGR